jgi:lipoate-protein ligase A
LHIIPHYLHSPAKPYLEAKGVDSVSSPVGNIGLDTGIFQQRLQDEFEAMYGAGNRIHAQTVDEDHLGIPEIKEGYEELKVCVDPACSRNRC